MVSYYQSQSTRTDIHFIIHILSGSILSKVYISQCCEQPSIDGKYLLWATANRQYSNWDSQSNHLSSQKSHKMFGDFNNFFCADILFTQTFPNWQMLMKWPKFGKSFVNSMSAQKQYGSPQTFHGFFVNFSDCSSYSCQNYVYLPLPRADICDQLKATHNTTKYTPYLRWSY